MAARASAVIHRETRYRGKRAGGVVADPPASDLEHRSETGGGWDHGCWARVDGVDDLGAIDPVQVDSAPRGAMREEMTDDKISSVPAGMPVLG